MPAQKQNTMSKRKRDAVEQDSQAPKETQVELGIKQATMTLISHLREYCQDEQDKKWDNKIIADTSGAQYMKLMKEDDLIIGDIKRGASGKSHVKCFLRAGPRATCFFHPKECNMAVVTCGGLCPGLNAVIYGIFDCAKHLYNVKTVYGIKGGYAGFYDWSNAEDSRAPLVLTDTIMKGIQHKGGTILGAARGGFDLDKIMKFLTCYKITQLFVIGGDGTHRGCHKIADEARRRKLRMTVAGVPKTIDNDLGIIDRSFGFNTAVEEACKAVISAKTEAECAPNGIGIVKLMGRSAGFISAFTTISTQDVDLCLVPEIPIVLRGPKGCLSHLRRVVEQKGHAVVVVAEGAGEELLGKSVETDAGGNRKLPPIGVFLKGEIEKFFKEGGEPLPASIKYIDPSYMIRSVGPSADDKIYCMQSAHNAVHGAMAGYTSFTTALVNNRVIMLPIDELTSNSPRQMDTQGRTWERVLCVTKQPVELAASETQPSKSK